MNSELEKGFKPGEIFQLIKSINEKRKRSKIVSVWEIFVLPDGTRAGRVILEDGGAVLKGETLIDKIGGKRIAHVYTISFTPDGELLYGALLEDGYSVIVKGDTVIDNIQGEKFGFVRNLFVLPDGELAGNIELGRGDFSYEGKEELPFKGRTIIREIGGKKITSGTITHVLKDGTLVGRASLGFRRVSQGSVILGVRCVPFKGEVLLDEIQGKKIINADPFFLLPDETLVGIVELEDGRRMIFKDDTLVEEIGGRKIAEADFFSNFYVLSDGTLAGSVKLEGSDKWVLFKDNTLIDKIQGRGIALYVSNDILYGSAWLEDGRWVPFKDDMWIDEINGRKIKEVSSLNFTPKGELIYSAMLDDDRVVIVKGDTIIDNIQGRRFKNVQNLLVLPNGTLAGIVELGDGRKVPFKGDVLLEELNGRKIIDSWWHPDLYLPDGTLNSKVKLENEDFSRTLFWYEDEVYTLNLLPLSELRKSNMYFYI